MSGINSRLIHDSCAISQKIKTSCTQGEYSMFLDYHINPNFRKASDIPCINSSKTVGCEPCDNNKNEEIFWNFSFDEIALYDLPAMVNYILDKTNQSKLFYVGHSQGNMVAFARLSTCPEFNSKIKLFLALGIEF
jgi:pimeloyl-ACP methyl ester carboxylesterase